MESVKNEGWVWSRKWYIRVTAFIKFFCHSMNTQASNGGVKTMKKMKENGKEGEGWFSLFPSYSHSFSLSFTFSGQSPGLLIVSLHLTSFVTEALLDSLIIQAWYLVLCRLISLWSGQASLTLYTSHLLWQSVRQSSNPSNNTLPSHHRNTNTIVFDVRSPAPHYS